MIVVLFGPRGWLGPWLDRAGILVVYAWPGMVLVCLFVTLPFVVREVVPVLREFGVDQEEAAYTLGAGRWLAFWRVTLPSIRWGLAYGVTLTVARSLGEFGALLVVSGNILGRTQTATLYLLDAFESFNTRGAFAASVLLAAISFALLIGMESIRKRVEPHEVAD
jgi:sulfate transport system permease protein